MQNCIIRGKRACIINWVVKPNLKISYTFFVESIIVYGDYTEPDTTLLFGTPQSAAGLASQHIVTCRTEMKKYLCKPFVSCKASSVIHSIFLYFMTEWCASQKLFIENSAILTPIHPVKVGLTDDSNSLYLNHFWKILSVALLIWSTLPDQLTPILSGLRSLIRPPDMTAIATFSSWHAA